MGTHPPRVAVRVPSRPHAVRMPLRHGCPRSPATDRQHVRPAPSLRCPAEASRPHRDYIPTSLRARNGPLHNENRLQSAQLGHTRARAPWFARISWTMTAGRAGEIAPEPRLPHRPCGHRCPVRVSRAGWRDRIHRRDGVDGLRSDHHQANRAGAQHTCRSDRLGAVPAGGPSNVADVLPVRRPWRPVLHYRRRPPSAGAVVSVYRRCRAAARRSADGPISTWRTA